MLRVRFFLFFFLRCFFKAYNFCFIHASYIYQIWKLKNFEMRFTWYWDLRKFTGPALYFICWKSIKNKNSRKKTTNAVHSAGRPCSQKWHMLFPGGYLHAWVNFYPPTKSEGYSFGVVRVSVRPFRPSVRPEPYLSTYWSDLIHSWYKW